MRSIDIHSLASISRQFIPIFSTSIEVSLFVLKYQFIKNENKILRKILNERASSNPKP